MHRMIYPNDERMTLIYCFAMYVVNVSAGAGQLHDVVPGLRGGGLAVPGPAAGEGEGAVSAVTPPVNRAVTKEKVLSVRVFINLLLVDGTVGQTRGR